MTEAAPIDTINTLNELADLYDRTASSMEIRAGMAGGNAHAANVPGRLVDAFQEERDRCRQMAAHSKVLAAACRAGAQAVDREMQRGPGK